MSQMVEVLRRDGRRDADDQPGDWGWCAEMVYAAFMGSGPVASAFVLAFQVPNLFRRLLGEGR